MQVHPTYSTFARCLVPYYGWAYNYDGSAHASIWRRRSLPEMQMRRLHHACAARIAAVYGELCAIADNDPSIYDYFELTDWQRRMLEVTRPQWRGIARADVFITTDDRIQICEVNSDTPGGIPGNAQLFNAAIRDRHSGMWDLNAGLTRAFTRWIERSLRLSSRRAAILFPPDANEDSAIIWPLPRRARRHGRQGLDGRAVELASVQRRRRHVRAAIRRHVPSLQERRDGDTA